MREGDGYQRHSDALVPGILDLALGPDGETFYATSAEAGQPGFVRVVSLSASYDLRVVGSVALSGELPCSVTLAVERQDLIVCNYLGGAVDVIHLVGGAMTEPVRRTVDLTRIHRRPTRTRFPHRQRSSHPHHALWIPERGHALVADLGSDAMITVALDRGDPVVVDVLPLGDGSGPRNSALVSSTRVVVACELDSTLRELTWDGARYIETGASQASSSQAPDNYSGALEVSSEHGLAIVANRGASTLGVFDVLRGPGLRLTKELPSGGRWPSGMAWTADHLFVANEHSDSVEVFAVSDHGLELVDSMTSLAAPKAVLIL